MADKKKISAKALSRSFHHWYYGNLTCFTQEHMQTFGYLTSLQYRTTNWFISSRYYSWS